MGITHRLVINRDWCKGCRICVAFCPKDVLVLDGHDKVVVTITRETGHARRPPEVGGSFIEMEDKISSLRAVIGASLTGLKSMTATRGPGFSLMQEAIGYAVMTEVPLHDTIVALDAGARLVTESVATF